MLIQYCTALVIVTLLGASLLYLVADKAQQSKSEFIKNVQHCVRIVLLSEVIFLSYISYLSS